MIQGMQNDPREEQMTQFWLLKRHSSKFLCGVSFKPRTIGAPIAADTSHTRTIVNQTLLLFLCFAYLIGCVTAMYLKKYQRLPNFTLSYLTFWLVRCDLGYLVGIEPISILSTMRSFLTTTTSINKLIRRMKKTGSNKSDDNYSRGSPIDGYSDQIKYT